VTGLCIFLTLGESERIGTARAFGRCRFAAAPPPGSRYAIRSRLRRTLRVAGSATNGLTPFRPLPSVLANAKASSSSKPSFSRNGRRRGVGAVLTSPGTNPGYIRSTPSGSGDNAAPSPLPDPRWGSSSVAVDVHGAAKMDGFDRNDPEGVEADVPEEGGIAGFATTNGQPSPLSGLARTAHPHGGYGACRCVDQPGDEPRLHKIDPFGVGRQCCLVAPAGSLKGIIFGSRGRPRGGEDGRVRPQRP
jgi:hypothetical protein